MAADPNALAGFMASISAVETGGRDGAYTTYGTDQGSKYGVARGKYQIMSEIWPGWAREAGYGDADWWDGYAQEAVTAYKMNKYWDAYQDWDLVAVAWFSGTGTANKALKDPSVMDRRSDGFNTVRQYVNKVRTAAGKATPASNAASTGAQQPVTDEQGNPIPVEWPAGISAEVATPQTDPVLGAREVSMSVMNNLSRLVQEDPDNDMREQVEQSLGRVFRSSQSSAISSSNQPEVTPSPPTQTGGIGQNGVI